MAGVRVFTYLDNHEWKVDTPLDALMTQFATYSGAMERLKARQRVMDAMIRKARAGYATGAAGFGFANVDVRDAEGRKLYSERHVVEEQAEVARRIFTLCASGKGYKAIAKALNAEGALAPHPVKGRPRGWTPSSVRTILYSRTFLGEVAYGKTSKRDNWGQRRTQERPEAEWVVYSRREWRIVSDELWQAAHARLDATSATYRQKERTGPDGRPRTGIASKYLLSGLARCALCGGSMISHATTKGRHRNCYYTCGTYSNRGSSICANRVPLPMAAADLAVLNQFADLVLDPSTVERAIADALAELRPAANVLETRRASLEQELHRIDFEMARYATAIAAAGDLDMLVKEMQEREKRRLAIRGELDALDRARKIETTDWERIKPSLRNRLEDWRGLLRRQAPVARLILSELVEGRLTFTPDFEARSYTFSGTATYGTLLEGAVDGAEGTQALTRGSGAPGGTPTSLVAQFGALSP